MDGSWVGLVLRGLGWVWWILWKVVFRDLVCGYSFIVILIGFGGYVFRYLVISVGWGILMSFAIGTASVFV